MSPGPQIIGQSVQLPDGSDHAGGAAPTDAISAAVPASTNPAIVPRPDTPRLDPTRYGDWERNGRCIDF